MPLFARIEGHSGRYSKIRMAGLVVSLLFSRVAIGVVFVAGLLWCLMLGPRTYGITGIFAGLGLLIGVSWLLIRWSNAIRRKIYLLRGYEDVDPEYIYED